MQIIENALGFLHKMYIALYTLYDEVIHVITAPLREVLPNMGIFDDILIELLDLFNWWGGADVTIFELIVGALLPQVLLVIVISWLWNTFKKILPL